MERKQTNKPLSQKAAMFCAEYLLDFDGSKAAIRAGYSPKNANRKAYELMQDPRVKEETQRLIEERKERLRMSADDVLMFIMEALQADIRKYVTWTEGGRARFKPSEQIDGRFVTKIRTNTRTIGYGSNEIREDETTFDLVSKEKMIDLLFKHFGLGAPLKIDTDIPFAQLVAGALEGAKNVSMEDD